MVTFFDESHARTIGLNPPLLKANLLCAALGFGGGSDADGRGLPRDRHGRHTRRDGLSLLRPVPRGSSSPQSSSGH